MTLPTLGQRRAGSGGTPVRVWLCTPLAPQSSMMAPSSTLSDRSRPSPCPRRHAAHWTPALNTGGFKPKTTKKKKRKRLYGLPFRRLPSRALGDLDGEVHVTRGVNDVDIPPGLRVISLVCGVRMPLCPPPLRRGGGKVGLCTRAAEGNA